MIERTLSRIDPRVGTFDELSVDRALSSSIWVERRLGQILSLFGVAALLLTAAGMYAVIALMVRSRERELGIRAALGARPHDLLRLILSESGRQLLLGLVAGTGTLWVSRRLLDSVLATAVASRASVFFAAAGVVALCCLSASRGPTARAARTDPSRCLRTD